MSPSAPISQHGAVPANAGDLPAKRALLPFSLLCVLLAYGSTVAALSNQWWTYLNHGFALIALVSWAVWRDRTRLLSAEAPWWPGLYMVFAGTTAWFICSLAGIQSLEQIALLAVLLGWALGVLGLGDRHRLFWLAGYLALSLPAWGFITGTLQLLTVAANSLLLWIVGLKATITGTYIAIPEGTFQVAEGCSGLNYFTSGMTIGFAYLELTALTSRGRFLALAVIGTLSLLSNWIRVFLLVLIGHWTNMQSSLMTDHVWFGWVIFALVVLAFISLTRRIETRYSATLPPSRTSAYEADNAERPVTVMHAARVGAIWAFTVAAVLGPIAATLVQQVPLDPSPAAIADLAVPAEWHSVNTMERKPLVYGDTVAGEPWGPQYAGADRHQTQLWASSRDTVQVDRLIFSGRDHRHKLLAQGNLMAHERTLLMDRAIGINEGSRVRSLRQAVVRVDSATNRAILYWYRVGDRSTGIPLVGRMKQVIASLTRSAPSELIVVSMICRNDCNAEFASLQTFVIGSGGSEADRARP
jgi:exosortase